MSKETILSHLIFDGYAVYRGLDDKARSRTSPENVSDVLDTLNRLSKQRDACGWPTCECALTPSQCKAPAEHVAGPRVVAWQYRFYDADDNRCAGGWREWQIVDVRGCCSGEAVDARANQIRNMIGLGYGYELRALCAAPVDQGARIAELEQLLRMSSSTIRSLAVDLVNLSEGDDEPYDASDEHALIGQIGAALAKHGENI